MGHRTQEGAGGVRPRTGGYSLVELMVVMFVIALLIAVAVPTYAGFRNRAFDADTKAELRLALTVERIYHLDNGFFSDSATVLEGMESLLHVNIAGDPAGSIRAVALTVPGTTSVCLYSQSLSGTWWTLYVDNATGTKYGNVAPAPCEASLASGWPGDGWQ